MNRAMATFGAAVVAAAGMGGLGGMGVRVAPQEGVALAPEFVPGEKWTYRIVSDSTAESVDGKNEKHTANVKQDVIIRVKVLSREESGAARLSVVLAYMDVHRQADGGFGGGMTVYEQGLVREGEKPPEGAQVARIGGGDATSETVGALIASIIRADVGPDGTITEISGLETAFEKASEFGKEGEQILGVFAPGTVKRTLSNLWLVDKPAEGTKGKYAERKVGEMWPVETRIGLGGGAAGTMVLTNKLKLDALDVAGATLSGTLEAKVERPGGAGDADPASPRVTVSIKNGTNSGKWDRAKGRLVERRAEATVESAAALGEGMTQKSTVTSKIEVKEVDADLPKKLQDEASKGH